MKRFKVATILLAALGFIMFTGHSAQCSDELFDLGAYWMPLTEGNTKSFEEKNRNNPVTSEPYYYTQTVQGKETVKGVEGVKVVVTDSNVPMGTNAKGAYNVIVPDLSEYKVTIKNYFPGNSTYNFRGSYQIPTPFGRSARYVKPGEVGDWFQFTSIATCFDDNVNIFGQKKLNNMAIDTSTTVVAVKNLGFEDVTVPAGTFTDCMKSKVTVSVGYAQRPENNVGIEIISWSAKGIGEVKNETSMMMANEYNFYPFNTVESGVITELVSATIDGGSYPR
ncbi:MAG: hypothetical protein NTX06_09120 [Proteobacteria bacterium]|nr:hypothetical protein [Pseudomonadota bacterium]